MKMINVINKTRGALKQFTLGLAVSAAFFSTGPAAKAAEIPVPNGSFETLYKPGSTTITADTGAGWTQGVGPNAAMEGGVATYSDATTGPQVDIPGWVNAPATGTPPNGGWAPPYDWPKGSGTIDRNNATPYGSYYYSGNGSDWGNPYGAAIQSAAPLTTVVSGETYTLSASFTDDLSGKVLDLLADGVILTPDSAASAPDGAWTKSTKTYGAASLASSVGKSLTIRVGWAVGASGGQAHLDNVQLNSLVLVETTPPTLTSFEDNKSGGPIIENEPVTYTVTFSEAMSASTVDSTDFENASTTTATTINSVTPTTDPAVFLVVATPTHAGTLRLQVKAGATLKDLAGNALNTTSAIPDDTIIIVNVTPPSTACDMLTFGANVAGSMAVITTTSLTTGTVDWFVPYIANVADLAPSYTISAYATCPQPNPGVPTPPFSATPVQYLVTAQDGTTTKEYTVTVTVAPNESALIWNTTSGDWDLATANWIGQTSGSPMPFFTTANVIFTNNPAGGTINITPNMRPFSTTVSAGNYQFSGGPIAAGSLTKDGSGTLKIDGLISGTDTVVGNTYSGGTIMNSGVLHLGAMFAGISPDCKGTVGTGPVTLNGGIIEFDRVTETNALIVNSGTLYSQNGWGVTWSGPITLNATLTCNALYTLTCSGAISGTGGLLKTSGGPLILSGTNTYTGPTTVTAGTLQCNNPDALGSGALSISSTTGTKVNLSYTGEHNVASLTLGGVPQTGGTYGSTASPATNKNDTYFAGTGMVRAPASSFKEMLTFSFGVLGSATIAGTNITLEVPFGTDRTDLAPTYTVSPGATCLPLPGTHLSFTIPQVYTVTAEDLSTRAYQVTLSEAVLANVFTWTNTASGNWSIPANWSNDLATGSAPLAGGGSNYTLNFNAPGTYTATNNMNPGFQLNQINFGSTVALAGNSLEFVTNGPTLPTINQNSGSTVTNLNDLALGANTTFGGSGNGLVRLFGVISGAGSLTKNGSGTLRIYHVNNSFTGGTIINSGTLFMDINAKLGTGPVTLNGGTIYMWRFKPTNPLTVNGGSITSENGFNDNRWAGLITLNTTLTCDVYYQLLCSNTISGAGGLIKARNGLMILSGTNTYTGPTTVTGGTLRCDNTNSLGTGALSISGGGKVNLNYLGDHIVTSLTLDGEVKPPGTYGSSGSGWGDDVHFLATGTGTVTVVPEGPLTITAIVMSPAGEGLVNVDITFTNTVKDLFYLLQYTDSLPVEPPQIWSEAGGAIQAPGTGMTLRDAEVSTGTNPQRFYRVKQNP